MSIAGGVNVPMLGGIIGAVLFAGVVLVVVGYLYYRRSQGKGFFSEEKAKTGGAAKVKAAPQAPNLAELGIGVGLSDEGLVRNPDGTISGDEIGMDEFEGDAARGIRISNGIVYHVQPSQALSEMSYPSRRSDPGETATEPSIGPGRSQTIKLGLASMSDVNVSTYANYPPDRPLTKAEEAALHSQQARMAAHNAATGSAPMYQPPSSSTPIAAMSTSLSAGSSGGLPSKLEKERIADLHYAHLNNQSASPSAPITTGAVAQNATITVLEPPSYATPPSSSVRIPEKSGLHENAPPPTPYEASSMSAQSTVVAPPRDVKVVGADGFPVIPDAPAPSPSVPIAVVDAPVPYEATQDVKVMGHNGFPAIPDTPAASVSAPAVMPAVPVAEQEGGATAGQDEFICVRAYVAQLDDEMELQIGDRVNLKQSFPDGWGTGINLRTGKEGVFPLSAIVAASLAEGSLKIIAG